MYNSHGIFDLDGTLVDSMEWWKGLAEEFLRSQGVEELPDSLLSQIKTMTIPESAALFIRIFGISGTVSSVAEEMNALMDRHYRQRGFVPEARSEGVPEKAEGKRHQDVRGLRHIERAGGSLSEASGSSRLF